VVGCVNVLEKEEILEDEEEEVTVGETSGHLEGTNFKQFLWQSNLQY
jgi:hypothetical protein